MNTLVNIPAQAREAIRRYPVFFAACFYATGVAIGIFLGVSR